MLPPVPRLAGDGAGVEGEQHNENRADGERVLGDEAESLTSDFFGDVLPKLISLAADAVFH